jgi:CheY-like chemotaxis protein/HPt (histidine-containing phosphotransfer) domain-containing protein
VKCKEVVNGMDAFEVLKEEQFDLLFMDIRMPGIDGVRTTQFIRDEMKISESDMPIVFISAVPMNEEMQKYRNAGMNAFLQKPFTEEILLTTILAALNNNREVALPYSGESELNKPASENKIDLKNLYHLSGGDDQFVKQMLVSFINTTQKGMKDMQEALNSGQREAVADLAHKLLSPCRHIGAMDLYNLLSAIDKGIRNNVDTEPLEILTAKSLGEFEIIREILSDYISKMK